ncbi:MAG: YesL family protein [Lachnospiraceae bacterium]|nr:YesL family protein [Lachnospiraceae bacterium]
MKLFNPDSGIMRSLSKFTDCICLSLLFFVSCIPIITIGTASTALYYTVHKVLRHDRGYMFRDYVTSFRDNFKQTTPVWLAALVIGIVLGLDLRIANFYASSVTYFSALSAVSFLGLVIWFAWISYLFPYMARFENTRKQSIKNAILMVIAHLPMTALMLVIAAAAGFALYLAPLVIFIIPSVYTWIQSYVLERIFRKYMTEEDREAEDAKYKPDDDIAVH